LSGTILSIHAKESALRVAQSNTGLQTGSILRAKGIGLLKAHPRFLRLRPIQGLQSRDSTLNSHKFSFFS
jgi:hypothetical protein